MHPASRRYPGRKERGWCRGRRSRRKRRPFCNGTDRAAARRGYPVRKDADFRVVQRKLRTWAPEPVETLTVQTEQTIGRPLPPWSGIDWAVAAEAVRRLQERIFRAAKDGDFGKVKNLQKLLVHSRSAKLLAIRQVTQQNRGRNTLASTVVCRHRNSARRAP